MVVFVLKWLYSGKVFVIGRKRLYLGKVVVFVQSCCIRAKLLYSGKVVVFGHDWLYCEKVVVFEQK